VGLKDADWTVDAANCTPLKADGHPHRSQT
jgi:hypothetical protein